LQSELYDDVATRSRADSRPWRPIPPGSAASPYTVGDPTDDAACFSVVELTGNELAGEALLNLAPPHATWAYSCRRAAEPISSGGLGVGVDGFGQCPQGAGLVQGPAWTVSVEVGLVLEEDRAQVAFDHDEVPVEEFAA
jgi:hypothetical protein